MKADSYLTWFLWEVPKEKLSPEAAQRLKRVLEQLGKPNLPLSWQRSFASLVEDPKLHTWKMLKILTAKESVGLIAEAAREAEKHRQR